VSRTVSVSPRIATLATVAVLFVSLVAAAGDSSAGRADRLATARVHLVFSSDRDGDDDVYAIEPSGERLSALTRNSTDDSLLLRSRDGRKFAVSRLDAKSRSQIVLLSADGGRERRVRTGNVIDATAEAFSSDGARLAFAVRRGREPNYWNAVGIAGSSRTLQVVTPNLEDYEFVAWAPDGKTLLLDHITYGEDEGDERHSLVVGGLTKGRGRLLTPDLACHVCAAWGAAGRVAFLAGSTIGMLELRLVDPREPGRQVSVARVDGEIEFVGWSPNGRQFAYLARESESEKKSLRLAQPDGGSTVIYHDPDDVVAWSPRGDTLAVENARGLDIVRVDGRVRRRIKWPHGVIEAAWAPDASRLGLVLAGADGGEDLWLANPANGRLKQLTRRGKVERIGWAPGPVPANAVPAAPVAPTELAGARALTATAPVHEVAASGRWVAAVVGSNARDCTHVVAWQPGRRAIRFNTPAPCTTDERLFRLRLAGSRLNWSSYYCGNNCYTVGVGADIRRPGAFHLTSDELPFQGAPRRLRTPHETRRGVTMTLSHGTIRLRAGHRAVRTIRPPGGAADAELEQPGLFYAHNQRGRGRVVFVPFTKLRTTP
jgi:Tol biopolymer transport system component